MVVIKDCKSLVCQCLRRSNLVCHLGLDSQMVGIVACGIVADYCPGNLDMVDAAVFEQCAHFKNMLMIVLPDNQADPQYTLRVARREGPNVFYQPGKITLLGAATLDVALVVPSIK